MKDHEINKAELCQIIIRKMQNWEATGADVIQNFWYKKLHSTHEKTTDLINKVLKNPELMPAYLTKGITYLIPKGKPSEDPAKYRPIACLCTLYKIITACITKKINVHCEEQKIIAVQQKGCQRGSLGCKEQLLIDTVVTKQACKYKINLYSGCIDYAKAYDSVPHKWLATVLKIYRIDERLITFLESTMRKWETTLILGRGDKRITIPTIKIRRGTFTTQ